MDTDVARRTGTSQRPGAYSYSLPRNIFMVSFLYEGERIRWGIAYARRGILRRRDGFHGWGCSFLAARDTQAFSFATFGRSMENTEVLTFGEIGTGWLSFTPCIILQAWKFPLYLCRKGTNKLFRSIPMKSFVAAPFPIFGRANKAAEILVANNNEEAAVQNEMKMYATRWLRVKSIDVRVRGEALTSG